MTVPSMPPIQSVPMPKPNGWESYVEFRPFDLKPYQMGTEDVRQELGEAEKTGNKRLIEGARETLALNEHILLQRALQNREALEAMNELWGKSPSFQNMVKGIYQGPLPPEAAPFQGVKLQLELTDRHGTHALVGREQWQGLPNDARAQQQDTWFKTVFVNAPHYATAYEARLGDQDHHTAADGKLVVADMPSVLAHEFAHVYLTQRYTENPLRQNLHPRVTVADVGMHTANSEALARMVERNVMLELGARRTSDVCDHPQGVRDCGALKNPDSAISRRFAELEPQLLGPRANPALPQLSVETLDRVGREVRVLAEAMERANRDKIITRAEAAEIMKAAKPLHDDLQPLIQARAPAQLPASFNQALIRPLHLTDKKELSALADKIGMRSITDGKMDELRKFNAVIDIMDLSERQR